MREQGTHQRGLAMVEWSMAAMAVCHDGYGARGLLQWQVVAIVVRGGVQGLDGVMSVRNWAVVNWWR
jgi:hypothetical protein